MSGTLLAPCPSCSRHVRVSEERCPHCAVALSNEFRSVPVAKAPSSRLSRAALYALGVGAIGTTVGCTTAAPAYGGPPVDRFQADAGEQAAQDAQSTRATIVDSPRAAYGAPPPRLPPADAGRK